jgi:arylsulfatase A
VKVQSIKHLAVALSVLVLAACSKSNDSSLDAQQQPNIIYILADDLGYGDLSCYGQKHFKTPHIDKLAKEGMRFIQHYAGSTVCAPSRSSLLTGMHTGHTPIRGNKEWKPEGQWPLPDSTYNLAEMLQEAGYVTGAFGKWGLGYPGSEGDPNNQGFDVFYGYNCQRMAHHYYPYHLWYNQEKILLEGNEGVGRASYGPDLIQKQALRFMEENQDRPFFMFYPSLLPHAELMAPEQYMNKYRNKYLPEKTYEGVDSGERLKLGPYGSQAESHAAFAAMINVLDDQVGGLMDKLSELKLEHKTIVVFSSDNGPHLEGGADPDYFDSNGILKGYKRDLYEGGIRVPMIVRWPGVVKPGTKTDHLSAFWDVMPTIAEVLEMEGQEGFDGLSFYPTLLQREQAQHAYLYWEFHEKGGRQAVRSGDWKLVKYDVIRNPGKPAELYNLATDPGETNDLSASNPGKMEELLGIVDAARTESDVFSSMNVRSNTTP